MSTDTWITSHCELNHLIDTTPSSSSSSSLPSLFNVNYMQQFANAFSKLYSPETKSFSSIRFNDTHLHSNYLSQTIPINCITDQQQRQHHQLQHDNNTQTFHEIFQNFLKVYPQMDSLQKSSLQNHELSSDKYAEDLTINRGGQYDLNTSDFNCSNTTLGTLPSPSEKSSPYDSSLCYSQHLSIDMSKQQTDNQQIHHQQVKYIDVEDNEDFHNKSLFNKLHDEEKHPISNEMNTFHMLSEHTKLNKLSNLYTTVSNETVIDSVYSISDMIKQDYKSPTKKSSNQIPYPYQRFLKHHNDEQFNDEQHAINLSMKKTNSLKTVPLLKTEKINHNIEINDSLLTNSTVYEYYSKLMQINYFEWFKYLIYQSSQITGNSSTSSPIPHLLQTNHTYYSPNYKSFDVNSLSNNNNNPCSKDFQNMKNLSFHHSNEEASINPNIFKLDYSNNLSNLCSNEHTNLQFNNYQSVMLNRLSTITSTTSSLSSYLPLQSTKYGLQSMTKDTSNLKNGVCNIKSKGCSTTSILSKTANTKNVNQTLIVNGSNNYACKLCSKVYLQASALKMHVRTHTLPCRCTHCGKSFSRKWLLKGHERTHTGERPYSCSVCSRSFADRSNLRAHMQTHQREKRYSCPQCPRSFSRMSLLNKHMMQCNQSTELNNNTVIRKCDGHIMKTSSYCFPVKFT
ncbi:hypothetical protein MN116_004121 [Schistosoma mekongi]|uniref:C2H2-type domain-containing protein n=1 Tax=Schistosoma mekongi TaxID=38744 RepID=A0AAE2D7F7_SCHME|nr:hypothetical protein MN116_004121 [Schistosoma mekongi]